MDIVNLNPMVAPVAGENIVMNSGGGSGSIIYFIVVILVIILLAVIGYFTMKGSSQTTTVTGTTISGEGVEYTEKEARSEEIKHLQEQAYIKYQTEQGNPPELNEDGSLVSDIISGDTPEPEPETIRFTDNGLMVENYIVMPDNIDYGYQTYAYNPMDTNINGSAITFDKQTNKCPDGTLDCLYYTRVEDGRVKSISDKDGNELIEKFMDDLWNGKLELLETPEAYEMMKNYKLNDKRQLMRDGKLIKPGVDLNIGQYLIIFSVMYRSTGLLRPKIVYDFPVKKAGANTQVSEPLPPITLPPAVGNQIEFVTPPTENTSTSTLNDLKTDVKLVTPVIAEAKATPPPTLGGIRDRIKF